MLRRAVIALQSDEPESGRGGHAAGEIKRGLSGGDSAAMGTDVDFHQDIQSGLMAGDSGAEGGDVVCIVDADAEASLAGQLGDALQFFVPDNFVADQYILHTALHHRLRFTDFLATDADRAQLNLPQSNGR